MDDLLASWTSGRRARGGWWALAGFSFQAAVYLLKYFQHLDHGGHSRSPATTELLSDVMVSGDGRYQLIQVKRTLTRTAFRSALREAYAIASLCDDRLLEKIRFSIACLAREPNLSAADYELEDVAGPDGDERAWRWLRSAFEDPGSIVVEADPLDRLYDFLWHAGILNIPAFVDTCRGILFAAFLSPSRASIENMADALAREFLAAGRRRDPPARIGMSIVPDDFRRKPEAAEDRQIVSNRPPRPIDVQMDRFRCREPIHSRLCEEYDRWWHNVVTQDEMTVVPIFWIDGRSGEGKSVLLLQLAAHVLSHEAPPVVSLLEHPRQLPDWISRQAEIQKDHTSAAAQPALVFIDDLHLIATNEEWESAFRAATQIVVPRVAIAACGPTLERESFQSRFSTRATITPFTVPNLDIAEMHRFAAWYSERSGTSEALRADVAENRLLVIWIFELVHGESIAEFAGNFRKRLEKLQLFELARTIIGTNALGLLGPMSLLRSVPDAQRDAFKGLCSESQLHFERLDGAEAGLRLGHPQIGWSIFREWAQPPTSIAAAWGRAISKSLLAALEVGEAQVAASLVHQAGTSFLLPRIEADPAEGSLREALRELFASLQGDMDIQQWLPLLPRWLDIVAKDPGIGFEPDPVDLAVSLAANTPLPEGLNGFVAGWLWRIGDIREYRGERDRLQDAAEAIILDMPDDFSVEGAISVIARRAEQRKTALDLCKRWLATDAAMDSTGRAISTIIAAWPEDEYVIERGSEWVKGMARDQQAHTVLGALLSKRPQDDELANLATAWIISHRGANQPVDSYLLEPLIAAHPHDSTVQGLALEWVRANPGHPQTRHILAPLLRGAKSNTAARDFAYGWLAENSRDPTTYYVVCPLISEYPDQETLRFGLAWVKDNRDDPQLHHVLTALLGAFPRDAEVRSQCLEWLAENNAIENCRALWASLISKWRDNDEVIRAAVTWAEANLDLPQIYEILVALVAARPADDRVSGVLLDWLAQNPAQALAYWPLATLVKARPDDDSILKAAVAWVDQHPEHPNAYWLLAAMVPARRQDDSIVRLALNWLDSHPGHQQAHHLLTPLVAARFGDRRVMLRLKRWLRSQQPHPRATTLVALLIARSSGRREWMLLGEAYLRVLNGGARRAMLLALLVGAKGSRRYVDIVMDAILAEGDVGARRHLSRGLGGCMAANVTRAVAYLGGTPDPLRKELAARALASALRANRQAAESMLASIDKTPADIRAILLVASIASDAAGEAVNRALGDWLRQCLPAPGYPLVLRALKDRPDRWRSLVAQEALPS
jgi:hypothetical protein